jgi:transposase-like protein
MNGKPATKEDFLESKAAIAEHLGITENTLDSWRKEFGPDHPNPLPVGKLGRSLISTKGKLDAWKNRFTECV